MTSDVLFPDLADATGRFRYLCPTPFDWFTAEENVMATWNNTPAGIVNAAMTRLFKAFGLQGCAILLLLQADPHGFALKAANHAKRNCRIPTETVLSRNVFLPEGDITGWWSELPAETVGGAILHFLIALGNDANVVLERMKQDEIFISRLAHQMKSEAEKAIATSMPANPPAAEELKKELDIGIPAWKWFLERQGLQEQGLA